MEKKVLFLLVFMLFFCSAQAGNPPVSAMASQTIGVDYSLAYRGQTITEQDIGSHEKIHCISLRYSPIQYLLFSAGIGIDKFTTDPYMGSQFNGQYGFSPSVGLSLFSPEFFREIFRATGGIAMSYLNSKDNAENKYSGSILNPYAGLIAALGKYADVEGGLKVHAINGSMGNTRTDTAYGPFSNRNIMRGYLSLLLKSPGEWAYMSIDFEMSPQVSKDWTGGPYESSLGFSIGMLLKNDTKNKQIEEKNSAKFPKFDEMKKKADKMEEKIE